LTDETIFLIRESSDVIKKRQNISTLNFNRSRYKSFIKKATSYTKDGKYYAAFRILLKSSKAAKTALTCTFKGIIFPLLVKKGKSKNVLQIQFGECLPWCKR
jgi:hypothetical protein